MKIGRIVHCGGVLCRGPKFEPTAAFDPWLISNY
jgi:hypothetical protein